MKALARPIVSLLLALTAISCGTKDLQNLENSSLATVSIKQTAVVSQGRVGFCWAYATTGLVESAYKMRSGKDIDLSEEAIAFYRLAYEIRAMYRTLPIGDLVSAFSRPNGIAEGWVTRSLPEDAAALTEDEPDALDIIKRHGIFPENVWGIKYSTEAERDLLINTLQNNARKYLSQKNRHEATLEDIISNILVGPGAFPSKPPSSFTFEGETFTPQDLVKKFDFDPDNYVVIGSKGEDDFDKIIAATKKSLARGVSVPLGFPINIQRLQGDTFSGKGVPADTMGELTNFTRDGGHLVLVTDFVNQGGVEGAQNSADVTAEMNKPSSALDYLLFKNSWGIGAKTNEAGILLGGSANGYYKLDQSYLRASARVGRYKGWVSLVAVVAKDIAESPFAPETLNQNVLLPN